MSAPIDWRTANLMEATEEAFAVGDDPVGHFAAPLVLAAKRLRTLADLPARQGVSVESRFWLDAALVHFQTVLAVAQRLTVEDVTVPEPSAAVRAALGRA